MDIAPAILDAIRREPDHEAHWLALAAHLDDNGEYDLAAVVRHHWDAFYKVVLGGKSAEGAGGGAARTVRSRMTAPRWI